MKPMFGLIWMVFFSLSCSSNKDWQTDPGTLRFRLSDFQYIDPNLALDVDGTFLAQNLFESLTSYGNGQQEPVPAAAEKWEVSKDGLKYTFYLRKNAKWSDGKPVTVDDFLFSFERILNPSTSSVATQWLWYILNAKDYNKGILRDFKKVGLQKQGDYQFTITLETPTAYFIKLTQNCCFAPIPKHVVEKYKNAWTLPSHIVSNGAYQLKEMEKGIRVVLVKNPHYWEVEKVKIKRAVGLFSQNETESLRWFMDNRIDWSRGMVPSHRIDDLKKKRLGRDFFIEDYLGVYYYAFNTARPPFNSPLVRQAFNLAIDKKMIAREILKGEYKDASGIVHPYFKGLGYETVPNGQSSVTEAKKRLEEAGFKDGKGIPPITIDITQGELHESVARSVRDQVKTHLNLEVQIRVSGWSAFIKKTKQRDFQIVRLSWIGDYVDPNTFLDLWMSDSPSNETGFKNNEFDMLLIQANKEMEGSPRMQLMQKAEKILLQELPILPIFYYKQLDLRASRIIGLKTDILGTYLIKYLDLKPKK